jgi:3-oxoacyl-[acyl-carrier protein] reductase
VLAGKTAVVTGASRGIGRVIACRFHEAGANVVASARSRAALEDLAQQLGRERCLPVAGDVTRLADLDEVFRRSQSAFGGADVLCHSAGCYPLKPIDEMSEGEWDEVVRTNLTSTFLAVKACLPVFREGGGGRIVLVSSITGSRVGYPGLAHYSASKAGMLGFMRTAALELLPANVTINAVEPGGIDLDLQDRRESPLGHRGSSADVSAAVLFLASDEARFITGQSIVVDGGQTLHMHPSE